jgi:hypothetical protein
VSEPSAPLPAPGAIEEALARVLARREFALPQERVGDDLWRWLLRQWEAAWSWLRRVFLEGLGDVVATSWLVELVVVVLAVVGAALLVRRLRRHLPSSAVLAADAPVADDATRAAREHLAAAAAAADAGRWLEAARALYLGVVLWLAARGQVRFDDATTGEEYARALPRDLARGPFRTLLTAFYPLAFGERPATADVYARMRGAASAMGVPD